MFSLEAYCRLAKLQIDGLVRSYGRQQLRIYRMAPELGPPELEELSFPEGDCSWAAEWNHFVRAIESGEPFLGALSDVHYVWRRVEDAYAASPAYADLRSRPAA
jgi:hypothetical protein